MADEVRANDFLLARLGEDEAAARKLLRRAQEHELSCGDPRLLGREIPGWHDWPEVQRVAARVLAECEAKRLLIERVGNPDWAGFPILVLPYADHPDYDEAWRP